MGADTRDAIEAKKRRRLKNYLLDRRFQLKYTGMMLVVTLSVAGVLGYRVYELSEVQTQALAMHIAAQPDLDPATAAALEEFARQEDRKVLGTIVAGVLAFALALALVGILVTHRVVGPAYRMQRLFERVARGHLSLPTAIRRGDELQDLYHAFADMVNALRAERAADLEHLEAVAARLEGSGVESSELTDLRAVTERIRKTLA